jgi:hypothetical protein
MFYRKSIFNDSTDALKYSKNPIFKHFFFMLNEQKTRFGASMVFNMTHSKIYGRRIISRHFQLVRISYQKLDFHGISRFSSVFIINILNALSYNSGTKRTMDTKSKFRFSFKQTPTLALVCSNYSNVVIPYYF